jgi:hypothetical protein
LPYLGSTVFFVTLFTALFVALNGYLLLVRSLAPTLVEEAAARIERRPVLTTLLGGIVGSATAIVSILFLGAGPGLAKLSGAVLAVSVLALSLAGTAGLAEIIGRGLSSPSDEGREWFRCLKGGVVLELTFLLPFFGWFFLLPVAVFAGLGTATAALVSKVERFGVSRAESA